MIEDKPNPRITILMAIYNSAPTLAEAIDSLYAQTYKDFKLVLCDDGSTDETFTIAKEYADRYSNIILLKNEKNLKLAASLNRCLEFADTEYIARMDGDDISLPTRFEREIDFLDSNQEYALVSCAMICFDETGDWGLVKPKPTPNLDSFKKGTPHIHAPCMVRTAIMKEVDGYTVSPLLNRGQDYYLWFKIYKAGYKGYNLQEALYKMRDDKEALNRRTFKNRLYSSIIKYRVLKGLNLSYPLLHASRAVSKSIVKAMIPKFIIIKIRKENIKI